MRNQGIIYSHRSTRELRDNNNAQEGRAPYLRERHLRRQIDGRVSFSLRDDYSCISHIRPPCLLRVLSICCARRLFECLNDLLYFSGETWVSELTGSDPIYSSRSGLNMFNTFPHCTAANDDYQGCTENSRPVDSTHD